MIKDIHKVLNWMITNITLIRSSVNFLMNQILICGCYSKIIELFHTFRGSLSCIYAMILACILAARPQCILSFFYVYFLAKPPWLYDTEKEKLKGIWRSSCSLIWCTIPASVSWTWGKSWSSLFSTAMLGVIIWAGPPKHITYLATAFHPSLDKICWYIFHCCVQSVAITVQLWETMLSAQLIFLAELLMPSNYILQFFRIAIWLKYSVLLFIMLIWNIVDIFTFLCGTLYYKWGLFKDFMSYGFRRK
jgi:hypothetical protein